MTGENGSRPVREDVSVLVYPYFEGPVLAVGEIFPTCKTSVVKGETNTLNELARQPCFFLNWKS